MANYYSINNKPTRRLRKVFGAAFISLIIVGGIAGFVMWDVRSNSSSGFVEGESRSVVQQADVEATLGQQTVDGPYFSFSLPAGWHEVDRRNTNTEQSITWHPNKKKDAVGHSLKLYIDVIPKDLAVNKLLPVDVSGPNVTYRELSDNCKNFTTAKKNTNLPQPSKWQGVDFICDLPSFVQNKVGTGTVGAVNATTIAGPQKGKHKYFFVYTDHNNVPDYQPLYTALKSFEAL